MRVVVCLALDEANPNLLAPARLHEPLWISGGVRTLHELAVAAAAAGYETEVRGDFDAHVLRELSCAAGVEVATPASSRPATADDILCVPDGIRDPMFFARVALMPSTPVYLAFAPPGLFGWSFLPGWQYVEALEVDPMTVGLPEQCSVIGALGFQVWANASTTGGAFEDAGVAASVLHEGSPVPLPALPDKDVDVVTVGDNRWAPITRRALDGFCGSWRELEALPNAELVREIGRGRVFVHCARIEGHSRLALEARLMGTCCVGLASNRFAVGFDEMSGGALVERPEDVGGVVEKMLADPPALAERQARARRQALALSDWPTYVERVGAAVAAVSASRGREQSPWRAMAAELAERQERLRQCEDRLAVASADRAGSLRRALRRLRR